MTAATIDLAPQQCRAVEKITDWYSGSDTDQVFRLFGYAGTGKTTLARHIVEQLGVRQVRYAAFTGKAAYVLRGKGCDGASTVHSLIYSPKEKVRAALDRLLEQLAAENGPDARAVLEQAIRTEQKKLQDPDWILREDSELAETDLLVLDEVSMVGRPMAVDLLSFGRRVLCLGDPAQLPPVDGGGFFIDATPDHLLTDIHRSALNSPVTRLATAVRNSEFGERGYGIDSDENSGRYDRLTVDELLGFDQILVGRNATRWQVVHLIRALRGLRGDPQTGDRIIVLANSSEAEVFNGQQFEVVDSRDGNREDRYHLSVRDEDGFVRDIDTWRSGFVDLEGEKTAKRDGRGNVVAATYAQAITVHKSQGSQWDSVLVVDEAGVFAGAAQREAAQRGSASDIAARAGHLNGRRWLYTAVTRAAQRVVIVPRVTGLLSW